MRCPHCQTQLTRDSHRGKIIFRCPGCGGNALTLPALRSLSGSRKFAETLWRASADSPDSGLPCPECGADMRRVVLNADENLSLELDLCRKCQTVWFDPAELEALPEPEPPPQDELPAKAKELLALRAAEKYAEEAARTGSAFDGGFWKLLPALLGMPVEEDAPPLSRLPLITWSLILICTGLFVLTLSDLKEALQNLGFIPSQWSRLGGLTIITSMFLHAGWGHLIGNMYFLAIFGDNVEDEFGHKNYAALILFCGLAATAAHGLLDLRGTLPCVGASGFISGVIACYTILFPQVRLGFLVRFFWLKIPAWAAFLLWMILQTLGASLSRNTGGTAYFAHLGGALAGAAVALVCKRRETGGGGKLFFT